MKSSPQTKGVMGLAAARAKAKHKNQQDQRQQSNEARQNVIEHFQKAMAKKRKAK